MTPSITMVSEMSESVRIVLFRTVKSVRTVRCVYNTGHPDTDPDTADQLRSLCD